MYYIKSTSGTVWNLVIIWGRRCYASSACISYMQTLIHKECNYNIYLHTSSACEDSDSFVKCFLPSVKWLDCMSDTAMLSKGSNCYYYIICVWILERLFSTNYVLVPNWQLWGLKSAVPIHRVGPVAECALPTLPCTLVLCTAIAPAGLGGTLLVLQFSGETVACAGHVCCSQGFLTKLGHLNRNPSLVPLCGDERAVQEVAGKGCTAAAPAAPASSLQPSPSSSTGQLPWPAESSQGQSQLGKTVTRDPGAGGGLCF